MQSSSQPSGNAQGSQSELDTTASYEKINLTNPLDAASVSNQGEFAGHTAGTGPQTTKGRTSFPFPRLAFTAANIHLDQVGLKVSEADHAPEFHAQTLPAGTAPAESTFTPDPSASTTSSSDSAIPGQGQGAPVSGATKASDTLGGSTSKDVHTGLGHPGSGQSSSELHDNSKSGGGLQGVGAGGVGSHTQDAKSKADFSTSVPGADQKTTGSDYKAGASDMSGTKDNGVKSQLEQDR
jgi:hypothetical protein